MPLPDDNAQGSSRPAVHDCGHAGIPVVVVPFRAVRGKQLAHCDVTALLDRQPERLLRLLKAEIELAVLQPREAGRAQTAPGSATASPQRTPSAATSRQAK